MSTNFTEKFASSIVSVLGCHDRVIFKGHLPFGRDEHLNGWVDGCLKMRRMDFLPFVEKQSQALVDHAKTQAAKAGVPYQPLEGRPKKEKLVQDLLRQCPREEGLVTVLQVMETCRTVKLRHGQGRPCLAFARRPQRVLYYYFLDPEFGLMHVRLQTWFPFTIQVYVNGHDWLAHQMQKRRSASFSTTTPLLNSTSPVAAQGLADRFSKAALAEDPQPLGPAGQPAARHILARQGRLLLGHRSGRVQHRCFVPESSQAGRTLSAPAAACPVVLLCPGHSYVPGPPSACTF